MESTTAIILGYLGVALMVGLSGVASCIGTSIAGMASVGAMKKNGGVNAILREARRRAGAR